MRGLKKILRSKALLYFLFLFVFSISANALNETYVCQHLGFNVNFTSDYLECLDFITYLRGNDTYYNITNNITNYINNTYNITNESIKPYIENYLNSSDYLTSAEIDDLLVALNKRIDGVTSSDAPQTLEEQKEANRHSEEMAKIQAVTQPVQNTTQDDINNAVLQAKAEWERDQLLQSGSTSNKNSGSGFGTEGLMIIVVFIIIGYIVYTQGKEWFRRNKQPSQPVPLAYTPQNPYYPPTAVPVQPLPANSGFQQGLNPPPMVNPAVDPFANAGVHIHKAESLSASPDPRLTNLKKIINGETNAVQNPSDSVQGNQGPKA